MINSDEDWVKNIAFQDGILCYCKEYLGNVIRVLGAARLAAPILTASYTKVGKVSLFFRGGGGFSSESN